jgi:hypothetical protein
MRIVGAVFLMIFTLVPAGAQYAPDYRRGVQSSEECPQGRQLRAQKGYPSTMTDCEVLDADTQSENQRLYNLRSQRRSQPPTPANPSAPAPTAATEPPKIDYAKKRIDDDAKLGYPSVSFEDFALDNKIMVRDEKTLAVEGYYHKVGNIDELFAVQAETLPNMSPPASHIIPLLVEDGPRDLRSYFLKCSEQSPNVGCWTRIRGTVTICSLTIFGNTIPKPCISVDGGWFAKN